MGGICDGVAMQCDDIVTLWPFKVMTFQGEAQGHLVKVTFTMATKDDSFGCILIS